MNRQERIAWFTVSVTVLAISVFTLSIPAFGLKRATAAFSILALIGLTPFFVWRGRGSTEVYFDERDRAIHSKAVLIAYVVFWLFFFGSCMGGYWIYGEQGCMPVEVLPVVAWLGFALLYFVMSAATIIQYRRGRQHARG